MGKDSYVLKLYPVYKYKNDLLYDKYELKFMIYLTKHFILTNITPHLVGLYKYYKCDNIYGILPKELKCPNADTLLLEKHTILINFCKKHIINKYETLEKKCKIAFVENCSSSLNNYTV